MTFCDLQCHMSLYFILNENFQCSFLFYMLREKKRETILLDSNRQENYYLSNILDY